MAAYKIVGMLDGAMVGQPARGQYKSGRMSSLFVRETTQYKHNRNHPEITDVSELCRRMDELAWEMTQHMPKDVEG